MTLRRTLWRPDTHPDTEIEYEWDDAVPDDQRVHTAVAGSVAGQPHPNPAALHAQVLGVNQRKNQALAEAEALGLDPGSIGWSLDAQGAVTLRRAAVPSNQRTALAQRLQARFGTLAKLG